MKARKTRLSAALGGALAFGSVPGVSGYGSGLLSGESVSVRSTEYETPAGGGCGEPMFAIRAIFLARQAQAESTIASAVRRVEQPTRRIDCGIRG